MAAGKRAMTTDPLTEHDVAASINRALLRAVKVLMEIRQLDGTNDVGDSAYDAVRKSRYLTNAGTLLKEELTEWGF